MPNICIDASPLGTGNAIRGIGTYVEALIGNVEQSIHPDIAPYYLMLAASEQDRLPDVLRTADARVQRVTARIPESMRWLGESVPTKALIDSLHQNDIALYHATVMEDIVRAPHVVTVATLHDLIPLHFRHWGAMLKHPDAHLAYRRQLQRYAQVDHIIAVSQATKDDAVEMLDIPPERITVVRIAVNPERSYVPGAAEFQAAQTALGLHSPYFLGVAASDYHKNLVRLIEAFAAFREEHPQGKQFHLYITGTWIGRSGRRVTDAIERLHLASVVHHLTGVPTPLMASLYHGATALVFPSLMEGFGLPILEAMRCGTAVITSNRSSMPEVGGDAALYVNPESTEALVTAMSGIASDSALRQKLIERGFRQSQLFSWDRMTNETIAVYRKILGSI